MFLSGCNVADRRCGCLLNHEPDDVHATPDNFKLRVKRLHSADHRINKGSFIWNIIQLKFCLFFTLQQMFAFFMA